MLDKIVINRYQPGLYGWELWHRNRELASGMGVRTIDGCLSAALPGLPDRPDQVELQYCALHLGAFAVDQLAQCPSHWAATIVARHAALTAWR